MTVVKISERHLQRAKVDHRLQAIIVASLQSHQYLPLLGDAGRPCLSQQQHQMMCCR